MPGYDTRVHRVAAILLTLGGCGDAPMTAGAAPAPAATAPMTEPGPAPKAQLDADPPLAADSVSVAVLPAPAYIEISDGAQFVNCDFILTNHSDAELELAEVQVSVYDGAGALQWRKFLNDNGILPSIETIPDRTLHARSERLVFNPLFEFPRDLELARLRFDFTLSRGEQRVVVGTDLTPAPYTNHARLRLPLSGRFIVWDGHDYLAHHRRVDYTQEMLRAFGFDSNAGRYSYDFIPVDESGAMSRGDEQDNASWFGFGAPIHATAPGEVVAVVDDRPDDRNLDMEALKRDLMVVFGNYIVVDHGHGEFSVFGHIQRGSAKVRAGVQVAAGQEIAAIGASGSSLMPHLHYQLQSTADGHAEGLPSYFTDFLRIRGKRRVAVPYGQVDSGDILEVERATTR